MPSPDHSNAFFRTTQWSMVLGAPDDSKILESLLHRYWGPIYAYIRRSGHPRDSASDLTQEFIAQILLERGIIQRADPQRGRFRTFIKTALRNFLVDQHRRSTAKGRAPRSGPVITGLALEALEPIGNEEPTDAFDRHWATTIFNQALNRVESDCKACGQQIHWTAFKAALINPALGHSSPGSLEKLAAELGIDSPDRLSSMIQTVRRKFKRTLRAIIEETVADPDHTDEELGDLKHHLGL